jgi:hypothetical protein
MSRDYLWKDYTCGYHRQVAVLRCVLIWLTISIPSHHGVHGLDPLEIDRKLNCRRQGLPGSSHSERALLR